MDEKFTGQVRDTETLNDFFNARYYTAPLMRFLSSDPGNAGADPTDPQTWNGYTYVRNNPLNATDPTGMDICSDGTYADTCVTDSAPPPIDLESICWWCWEYGYPYTGPQQPAQPAKPQQPTSRPQPAPTIPGNRTNCVAGFTAAGSGVGAGVGAFVAGGAGAVGGAGYLVGSIVCNSSNSGGGGATNHGNQRYGELNISQQDVDQAIETAKETGQFTTKIGKYGTPQNVYNGSNGLTVVVETAGRNAGKVITAWWR